MTFYDICPHPVGPITQPHGEHILVCIYEIFLINLSKILKECWTLSINNCLCTFPKTNGTITCPYPYMMSIVACTNALDFLYEYVIGALVSLGLKS